MTELTGSTLMSISVSYYCVTDDIVYLCDEKVTQGKESTERMYFMYNGGRDVYVHGECYCSLHANDGVGLALYWLDVRLHKQAVATPIVCGTTTLYWDESGTSHNTSLTCLDPFHRAPFMEKHVTKKGRTWVQLNLGQDRPSMVWIMAEGKGFDVQCKGFEDFQTAEMSPATTPTEISLPSTSLSSQSTRSVTDPGVSPETRPSSTASSSDVTKQRISTGIVSSTPASSTYVTSIGPNRVTVSNSMSSSTSNGLSENSADGGLAMHWDIALAVLGAVMSTGCVLLGVYFRRRWKSREHTRGEQVDRQASDADSTVCECRSSPCETIPVHCESELPTSSATDHSTHKDRRRTVDDYSEIELDTMGRVSFVTEKRNHIYNHLHQTSPTRSDKHVSQAYSHVRSPGHKSDTYDHLKSSAFRSRENLPEYDNISALKKEQPGIKSEMTLSN
ncbi:hypothetical protein ScPMuIL_015911 [Solemya velum]